METCLPTVEAQNGICHRRTKISALSLVFKVPLLSATATALKYRPDRFGDQERSINLFAMKTGVLLWRNGLIKRRPR